jgi:hypothetical protein
MYALVSIYKMHVMFTKSHYALGSFSLPVNQPHPPLLGVSLGHDEDTRDFCNQNLGSSIFFKKNELKVFFFLCFNIGLHTVIVLLGQIYLKFGDIFLSKALLYCVLSPKLIQYFAAKDMLCDS